MIALDVTDAQGRVTRMARRDQRAGGARPARLDQDIIKPARTITIEGWASRDGRPYMRLRRALDARALIGSARSASRTRLMRLRCRAALVALAAPAAAEPDLTGSGTSFDTSDRGG
jgi:hypothetical protein